MYDASQLPKVIYGVNWATRTFNRNAPDSPQDEVIEKTQEKAQVPKSKEPKKKAVVIEVLPWELMPEGYADYRPLLQRDGLILFSWEIYDDEIKIIWLRSNGAMYKYQALIDDENELETICPEVKFTANHHRCYTLEEPDFIIYAAPPCLTASARKAFIVKLKASGVSVNFDYEFTLGKQKAIKEAAVFDRIENRQNYLSADEAEFLEAYRQLSDEGKTELIKSMKVLLNEQEREIKNA